VQPLASPRGKGVTAEPAPELAPARLQPVFIDLSKVSLGDASGLAVLVGIGRRARLLGGFMRLAAVSPQADRVLHITGLHQNPSRRPACWTDSF